MRLFIAALLVAISYAQTASTCTGSSRWCPYFRACVILNFDTFLEECLSEVDVAAELTCEDYERDAAKCALESEWCQWDLVAGCKDREDKETWNIRWAHENQASVTPPHMSTVDTSGTTTSCPLHTRYCQSTHSCMQTNIYSECVGGGTSTSVSTGGDTGASSSNAGVITGGGLSAVQGTGVEGLIPSGTVPDCGAGSRWCESLHFCIMVNAATDNFLELCPSESDRPGKERSCEDYERDVAGCAANGEWCYWDQVNGCKDKETIGVVLKSPHQKDASIGSKNTTALTYALVGTLSFVMSFLSFTLYMSRRKPIIRMQETDVSLI